MKKISSVEQFIEKHDQFSDILQILRTSILSVKEFEETIKWGMPCYTYQGKNILGLAALKSYAGIWFFQGALIKDAKKVLVNAQEGKTQAQRQWRFTSSDQIDVALLSLYIEEALLLAKEGKTMPVNRNKPLIIPDLLSEEFKGDVELELIFNSLSLSKKREFTDYITEAKLDATKEKRLKKIIPMIKAGIGLNDKYRKN